jgi:siroheme synthase-like protein
VSLFPVFLKLKGRHCLVVGAGPIGEGKARGLLERGATVRIVGLRATETVRRWAKNGKVVWLPRSFHSSDLAGAFLVVVATSSRKLNQRVYREALRQRVLCNVVDDPVHCDFYYGAIVRRGPLQIAISTSGRSPALAQRLKHDLEDQFGPEFGVWVEQLGRARRKVRATTRDPRRRKQLLHRLASWENYAEFVRNKAAKSQDAVLEGVSEKR